MGLRERAAHTRAELDALAKIDAVARHRAELWSAAHYAAEIRLGKAVSIHYLQMLFEQFLEETRSRWKERLHTPDDPQFQAELDAEFHIAEAVRDHWELKIREQKQLTDEIVEVQQRLKRLAHTDNVSKAESANA